MRFRCNKLRHEMWNLSLRRFLKSQLPGTQKAFNYTTCIEELLRDTILLVQVPLPRNLPRWDVSKYNSNFNQLLVQVQVLVKVQHVQNRCSDYPEMSWLLVMLRTFFTCKLQRLQSMLSQTSAGSFTQQARRLRATVQVALSVCFRALERVNTHSTSSTLLRKKYSTSTGTQYLYKYIVLVQYSPSPVCAAWVLEKGTCTGTCNFGHHSRERTWKRRRGDAIILFCGPIHSLQYCKTPRGHC